MVRLSPFTISKPTLPLPPRSTACWSKKGDHVKRGQILLQLDDADIRAKAAAAEAQIKAAQADQNALKSGGTQEEVITLNSQLIKARSAH